jgi:hypothetical protein
MDCETTIECYRELRNDGPYREEAIDLLIDEVNNSTILADSGKTDLLIALYEIRKQQAFGESAAVKRFWSIVCQNVSIAGEIIGWVCLRGECV